MELKNILAALDKRLEDDALTIRVQQYRIEDLEKEVAALKAELEAIKKAPEEIPAPEGVGYEIAPLFGD